MSDCLSPEQRHNCMSRIRGKNTTPEMMVRKELFSHGYRYRVNVKNLPCKPDIVLRKYNTVIFVNGCFWHGHEGCKKFVIPKTNTEFWKDKIRSNQERDKEGYVKLKEQGWKVIVVWECELTKQRFDETMNSIFAELS